MAKAKAAGRPPEISGSIAVADVRPSPTNPRRTFDDDSLRGLADSIKSSGQLQDILVRPVGANLKFDGVWKNVDHYEIVDGERRYRACVLGGVERISVKVRAMTDAEVLLAQLAANDQREDVKPSEQAAAYRRLADAGRSAEQIAADTGKPVRFVRGLLRLGKLPAWALAAVDAGTLPRATAELVARVPGEESRAKAAACVRLGCHDPSRLLADDLEKLAQGSPLVWAPGDESLSYRDTKDLIRNHFTRELKGAPFSLKMLYLEPGTAGTGHERHIPSCDECPKRAANDPEALADGTRPDVCLDPECYRAKVEAYRDVEVSTAALRGIDEAPIDDGFATPPKGWCDVSKPLWQTELAADFPVGPNANPAREEPLNKWLKAPGAVGVPQHVAFDRSGAAVFLVRTEDARKALRSVGLLKKEEKRKAEKPSILVSKNVPPPPSTKPARSGPSEADVSERAVANAGRVLAEFGEMNFDDLDTIQEHTGDDPNTSAVWEAFRFVARFLIRDHIAFGIERGRIVERALGMEPNSTLGRTGVADAEAKLEAIGHRAALALCLRLSAECELQSAPRGPFGKQLLDWCELDWDQLEQQARRELSGGETAEAKVAKAEAEQEAEPEEPPAKKSRKAS